jgi:hypothetical protein
MKDFQTVEMKAASKVDNLVGEMVGMMALMWVVRKAASMVVKSDH